MFNKALRKKYEHEYILYYDINMLHKEGFDFIHNMDILDSLHYMNRADIESSLIKHPILYIIIYNPYIKKYICYQHDNDLCLGITNHIYHYNGINNILYKSTIDTFRKYYEVPIKKIHFLGTYYNPEASFNHILHIVQIDTVTIKNSLYQTVSEMARNILNYDTVSKNIIAEIMFNGT